jgi:hypothetical protein
MTTPPADGMPTTRGTNFYLADPNLAFGCASIMCPDDLARGLRFGRRPRWNFPARAGSNGA